MPDTPEGGASRPPTPTTPPAPPPTPVPDRGSRLSDGVKSIGKALWFVVSLLLYALGLVFFYIGRALISLSGWGADTASDDPPQPPRTPPVASA